METFFGKQIKKLNLSSLNEDLKYDKGCIIKEKRGISQLIVLKKLAIQGKQIRSQPLLPINHAPKFF